MSGIASIDLQRAVGNQGANREKNSQKNLVTQSWGLGSSREEKGTHTQERRSRDRLEGLWGAPAHRARTEGWGHSRDQPQQLKATFTRERLHYRFPLV